LLAARLSNQPGRLLDTARPSRTVHPPCEVVPTP